MQGDEEACDVIAFHLGMEKMSLENMNSYERKKLEDETKEKLVLIQRERMLQFKVATA